MWFAPDSVPSQPAAMPAPGSNQALPSGAALQFAPAPALDQAPAVDPSAQEEAAILAAQERQSDALAWEGPASIAEYQFDAPLLAGMKPDFEQERAFREFFFDEGIPVGIAREFNRQAMLGVVNPPTPIQLELDRQQGLIALEKVWGADRDANLALANREVARLATKRPDIITILENTGLGNSPWLAQTLVNLARAKGRAK